MMLCLLLNVMTDRFALRRTYCERAVTFLPCKIAHANLVMHPTGRNRLWFAKNISQAVRRTEANQQMHMIGNAIYALGNSVRCANDSTKVRMQVAAPCRLDHRIVILRSENDVIMEAQMR